MIEPLVRHPDNLKSARRRPRHAAGRPREHGLQGTTVAAGTASGIGVATRMNTEIGHIARVRRERRDSGDFRASLDLNNAMTRSSFKTAST